MDPQDRIRIIKLRELIRDIPDFPKPGVVFKDITPLLGHPAGLSLAVEYLTQPFRHTRVDMVAGAESRGFIFGTAVARNLSAGFVPIRKPGRLPHDTHSEEYALEYGVDRVEIHKDAIQPGDRVLMVDDVLATGGTMAACCRLVKALGGEIVGIAFEQTTAEEGAKKVKPFAEKNGIKYPLAAVDDADPAMKAVPELEAFPTTLFLDREGKVRLRKVGYHEYGALEGLTKALLDAK